MPMLKLMRPPMSKKMPAKHPLFCDVPMSMVTLSHRGKVFRRIDKSKILALRPHMMAFGLMCPITVARRDNGKYLVVDGGSRLRVMREMGWTGNVPVIMSLRTAI